MNIQSLVSVNIRSYNSEDTLRETLKSIKEQSYTRSIPGMLEEFKRLGHKFFAENRKNYLLVILPIARYNCALKYLVSF